MKRFGKHCPSLFRLLFNTVLCSFNTQVILIEHTCSSSVIGHILRHFWHGYTFSPDGSNLNQLFFLLLFADAPLQKTMKFKPHGSSKSEKSHRNVQNNIT